ncbi:MAG: PIN domain-containing protein [Nanoarchaeota archaeon]|nr:PIN domain-containing protein [Nanoarchaeota archaeon]MBU1876262.1 PIN domain-containing protein [Nanoarchaeota archaeon]
MAQKTYYVESCIWLNLFKKEVHPTKGTPFWKIAKDFLEDNNKIIVSTIGIKEISFKIPEKIDYVMKFFKENDYIEMIKTRPEDYDLARKFEDGEEFKISFYDYLHVAIAKRLNVPLITRDNELIEFAKKHVEVFKPEELIN